jgi:hypothetical protein
MTNEEEESLESRTPRIEIGSNEVSNTLRKIGSA